MPQCRCQRCGSRRTLTKLPENYRVVPRCLRPSCYNQTKREGKRQRWRVDVYRQEYERRSGRHYKKPCTNWRCNYHFPHRAGSLGCIHHPLFGIEPEHELELMECPF